MSPCGEGKNFSTCKSFENGIARRLKDNPCYRAAANTCPKCDKKDDYDGDKIRIVKGVKYGARFGLGPSKSDPGFELPSRHARKTEHGFEVPSFGRLFCPFM